ncbi:hypothetical protein Misp01_55790 [Microtetraspora sp. NBRC 13810]|nr:hypothetical protein Misp01_55790 [Microtetraspora sp. NBRC 13810]
MSDTPEIVPPVPMTTILGLPPCFATAAAGVGGGSGAACAAPPVDTTAIPVKRTRLVTDASLLPLRVINVLLVRVLPPKYASKKIVTNGDLCFCDMPK